MRNVLPITILTLSCFIGIKPVFAQQTQSKCTQIEYSTPDASRHQYQLSKIEGQAVYASPQQKWEMGPGGGVCIVIFDKTTKSQIAEVTSDDKGQFEFAELRPGAYTLVASAGDLQVISIPIQISNEGKTQSGRLLLHLRETQDKRKSYVTIVMRPDLRRELLAMLEEDQNIRNENIKNGADHPSKEILARMEMIDRRNTLRMKALIKEYGWPGPRLVGWDGSDAAFFVIQHSDHQTQKDLLPLLQNEFKKGGLSGPHYALFIDRVLVEDGRPQIYGSKSKPMTEWKNGEPVFYTIQDESNVDRRRAEVGLSPMVEYRKFLKEMYQPK